MWERAGLKYYAKEQLRQYYWTAFAVCLVGGLLGGSGVGSNGGGGFSFSTSTFSNNVSGGGSGYVDPTFITVLLIIFLIAMAFAIALAVFVSGPMTVGISTWFIAAPRGYRDFGLLFYGFRGGRYWASVKTMFFTNLYIFLWTLVFVIPGVIKSYEYRMVPYLISDHPYLTPDEAMEISRQMTNGQKWEMFVLDLSFIGWYLLGALALGIGILFVHPYVEATWAQLYFVQRRYVNVPPPPAPVY